MREKHTPKPIPLKYRLNSCKPWTQLTVHSILPNDVLVEFLVDLDLSKVHASHEVSDGFLQGSLGLLHLLRGPLHRDLVLAFRELDVNLGRNTSRQSCHHLSLRTRKSPLSLAGIHTLGNVVGGSDGMPQINNV